MRYIALALLFAAPTWSMAGIAPSLLEELGPPPLDADGCALSEEGVHKERNEAGELVECGQYLDGAKEGYWVLRADTDSRWQGWFRKGKEQGTWLVTSPSEQLLGVARYDKNGQRHGVSYELEPDGRLIRHYVHAHGSTLSRCGMWVGQC
ncbi:hypothetical protein IEI94_15625 [Halomonas sp. ML-15]|uniref:toxin-antitoxin system YwqK family antitoxin n=1 Tax=Halomonas sp. ML-15 TaxID=2773305 RepID=UPI001746D360|nr:hypothetical protein [Halomonas sp. ML-15]MBD3897284.1 hypothetical protein [Halomonas sp. ML-15]